MSARALRKEQDRLVKEQVGHVVAPFSPYWKRRFSELGRSASSVSSVASLATLPAVGERDVCPDGDPSGLAALVVQATESGFALHAPGPTLRRALWRRVTDRDEYRQIVAADTKPTTYLWSGLGMRFPVASTRGDLDVIARAGARLWGVLGLTENDALLSAVPVASTVEHVGLTYAAMAAGAPALFPGSGDDELRTAARLAPPTVLAVPSARAAEVIGTLAAAETLGRLTTVLLVGAPSDDERAAAQDAAGQRVAVLAVHAPSGARVLWAECRGAGVAGGLHTYPDLDVVQLVDPESGEAATTSGELVLTQLGLRGTALLRWRTGDLVDRIESGTCPDCKRSVPRVYGVRRAALVLRSDDGRALDLRAMAGAMAGRGDLGDWRVVVGRRERDGRGQVIAHIVPTGDAGEAAVAAAADIRSLAGLLPTQIVASTAEEVAALDGSRLTPRILLRG
jgi:phenylacetate-coenzyme A ligase PaaK-like adenylate-forming protein